MINKINIKKKTVLKCILTSDVSIRFERATWIIYYSPNYFFLRNQKKNKK
jgi:hypothetical protein